MGDFNENYHNGYGNQRGGNDRRDEIIFSRKVRAGKRTYFFDVKTTRGNDYFITLSESKKSFDGHIQKSKIFLYKEDVNKFMEGLEEVVHHLKAELLPDYNFDEFRPATEEGYSQPEGQFNPPAQPGDASADPKW